jgi:hypothetical protein
MQIKYLLPKTSNFATNSSITGPTHPYNPISSTVGLLLLSLVSSTTTATTVGTATIEVQGTVDDVEWFTLLSVPVGSLKMPVGHFDVGTANGARNYTQVIQTMPRMRIVTSGALCTVGGSTTFLRAVLLNG